MVNTRLNNIKSTKANRLRGQIEVLQKQLEEEEKYEHPLIALRRLEDGELDDTVIRGVESVHFELMSDKDLWLGVNLINGERMCFNVEGLTPAGNSGKIRYEVIEFPQNWIDLDKEMGWGELEERDKKWIKGQEIND